MIFPIKMSRALRILAYSTSVVHPIVATNNIIMYNSRLMVAKVRIYFQT